MTEATIVLDIEAGRRRLNVTSRHSTQETLDGRSMTFDDRILWNGELRSRARGTAHIDADGGLVRLAAPVEGTFALPPGTIFPMAHARRLIAAGRAKAQVFDALVFDGTIDQGGLYQVKAEIFPDVRARRAALEPFQLDQVPAWRMGLTYIRQGRASGTPDREQWQRLHANGVVSAFAMKLGNVAVHGELVALRMLDAPACG